jgi:hypothetical protein
MSYRSASGEGLPENIVTRKKPFRSFHSINSTSGQYLLPHSNVVKVVPAYKGDVTQRGFDLPLRHSSQRYPLPRRAIMTDFAPLAQHNASILLPQLRAPPFNTVQQ